MISRGYPMVPDRPTDGFFTPFGARDTLLTRKRTQRRGSAEIKPCG
jgi:hypothetical protein